MSGLPLIQFCFKCNFGGRKPPEKFFTTFTMGENNRFMRQKPVKVKKSEPCIRIVLLLLVIFWGAVKNLIMSSSLSEEYSSPRDSFPVLVGLLGERRYGHPLFKRARDAEAYARRWARKAEGLVGLKEDGR